VSASTALVAIAPAGRDNPAEHSAARHNVRANADFVAQLIATAAHAPQTRLRRRVEPAEAVASYRAVGQWPTEAGHALSRSL
jgi:hypothetical protein